eukprot:355330-Chlamydomonas_euryale.AAC.1
MVRHVWTVTHVWTWGGQARLRAAAKSLPNLDLGHLIPQGLVFVNGSRRMEWLCVEGSRYICIHVHTYMYGGLRMRARVVCACVRACIEREGPWCWGICLTPYAGLGCGAVKCGTASLWPFMAVIGHTSHVTRHTMAVIGHTSHVTPHTMALCA